MIHDSLSLLLKYNKDASVTVGESRVGYGATAVYTIIPKTGKAVVKATVNGVDYTNKLFVIQGGYTLSIVNVKEDVRLVLEVEKVQYNVTIEDTEGGTLSVESTKVDAFGVVKVTANAQEGYYLLYFLVNGEKTSSQNGVVTIENVTEDLVVSAVYTTNNAPEKTPSVETPVGTNSGCMGNLSMNMLPIMGVGSILCLLIKKRKENV